MSNVRQREGSLRSLPFDEVELLRREVEAYFGRRPNDWWPRRETADPGRSAAAGQRRGEDARRA